MTGKDHVTVCVQYVQGGLAACIPSQYPPIDGTTLVLPLNGEKQGRDTFANLLCSGKMNLFH